MRSALPLSRAPVLSLPVAITVFSAAVLLGGVITGAGLVFVIGHVDSKFAAVPWYAFRLHVLAAVAGMAAAIVMASAGGFTRRLLLTQVPRPSLASTALTGVLFVPGFQLLSYLLQRFARQAPDALLWAFILGYPFVVALFNFLSPRSSGDAAS